MALQSARASTSVGTLRAINARWAGYAAASVAALRLAYAVIERSGPARVHLPTPRECWNHLRVALAVGAFSWLSGWISRWDRFWGADWPLKLHSWLAFALQVSVALHLGGAAISSALESQSLVRAMLTGNKYVDR